MKNKLYKCSICGGEADLTIENSHNASPINGEPSETNRCCDDCNEYWVIPARVSMSITADGKNSSKADGQPS
jgi:hypothetical protein